MSTPNTIPTATTTSGTTLAPTVTPSSGSVLYKNSDYGFSMEYPKELTPPFSFTGSYLLPNLWSTLASPESSGTQIVAWRLPASNTITSAELRISASSSIAEVAKCTNTQAYAGYRTSTKTINGALFTVFELENAAMGHHSNIKSYRILNNTSCMAIEEVITGTNPHMYDPVAIEPFTREEGFKKLDELLTTVKFDKYH